MTLAWTSAERRAWAPPERLGVIEWTERYRVLDKAQSAIFGPMRFANAPHTRGIATLLERARDLGIEQVWVQKSGQVAMSETIRSYLGWLADQRPVPAMLILPNEDKGREIVKERLIPMFEKTEPLKALATDYAADVTKSGISLRNGFTLFLAWSGSPTSLASHPIGIIVADEVDKFSDRMSREADPLSLALQRLKTYGADQMFVAASTPTTDDGPITSNREACPIQLRYVCPCPYCSRYQEIDFEARVKYPSANPGESKDAHANRLSIEQNVWYECLSCAGQVREPQRRAMLAAGVWATEEAVGRSDFAELATAAAATGIVFESWPRGRKVGLQIGDAAVLWVEWWRLAEEWVRSDGDPEKRQDFYNSRLGLPFKMVVQPRKAETFAAKSAAARLDERYVPEWATHLIATADTQRDHFYYVVRAWGPKLRSARVTHGVAADFDELRRLTVDSAFAQVGGGEVMPLVLGIDVAGDRTQDVYQFLLTDETRLRGLRGANRRIERHIATSRANYRPPPGVEDLSALPELWVTDIDTDWYKDRLAGMIVGQVQLIESGEIVEVEQWGLNRVNDDEYNRQLASEVRVKVRVGNRMADVWQKVTDSAANHYWDCEVYQVAMTDVIRIGEQPAAQQSPAAPPRGPRSNDERRRDGPSYLNPRRNSLGPRGGWRR